MEASVAPLVNLYKFPLGRARFALLTIAQLARAFQMEELAALAEQRADEVQQGMHLVARYRVANPNQYPPEATELDRLLDRLLAGFFNYLDSQIQLYPGTRRATAAEVIQGLAFPGGLKALVKAPFAEQHEMVSAALSRIRDPKQRSHVAALSDLPGVLSQIAELNDEYGVVLRTVDDRPTQKQVQEVHARTQESLAEVMCAIIGTCALRPGGHGERRQELLEPLLRQNQAIREARRRRRRVVDVSPDTGEELPPSDGESPDPSNGDDPGAPESPVAAARSAATE